jgi:RNA 2'-O ribose methyltransferase substrate binding
MHDQPEFDFLYGMNPVTEALRAGRRSFKRLFINQLGRPTSRS